ncbi:hypothetical protein J4233_03835 [Candidatus Pacearchaeota archaeon]|nr:hypothetical protein [Candidatus Pacearchaeota archaeon]
MRYHKRLRLVIYSLIFLALGLLFAGFASAETCWLYTSNATGQCTAANGCIWKSDPWGSWCQELNCWSLNSQSECTSTNVPGKNCTWQGGGTSYGCEKLSCWSLSGTNEGSCVNNSAGLSCDWGSMCYSSGSGGGTSVNCAQNANQSSCLNATGCDWGSCSEKGCWSYGTNTTCNAAKDWNGRNCTWSSNNYCEQNGCWKYSNETTCANPALTSGLSCQWKYNSCQDVDCYSWDFTNATACVNNTANLSCSWGGSYCMKQDCWSYNTQSTCQNKPSCLWKTYVSSGWCNEVNCWSWDSMNGGNQSGCESNTYGLPCSWSGNPSENQTNGWCYKNMASVSCSNFTTERACMDTYYCWWQYTDWNNPSAGGSCSTPGSFGGGGGGTNTSILNDWNPGCYIFDMNSTDCNSVLGCNSSNDGCVELSDAYGGNISLDGLNCSYINDSSLCNSIPALSSCCSWQNGTCAQNQLSSTCRDQMETPPAGASFCEDYSSFENQALCEQIAGSPWYMPCMWDNSTARCSFKASDVFGNESQSLSKINNKKNCEAAGGKWVTENYCEGNISVPTGRCEYKFDEEDNCDKACFACETKDGGGSSVNATNAASACIGSKSGICDFTADTNAPNGIGYCKAKNQYKKGLASNCDSSCGDCSFKGDPNNNDTTKKPSYYCTLSKANSDGGGCKWMNDNSTATGGNCVNKGEKTCEDSCDKCNTQTDCSNLGRTGISNQTGSCKWQGSTTTGSCVANIGEDVEICWDGIDNTDDNLIDCSDPSCYADSFCGFVSGDCFGWATSASCDEHNSTCEWVTDNWGSWCDFKGSQCWKYNSNEDSCGGIVSANQILNISLARLAGNQINTSKTFTLSNLGTGWINGSIFIYNASGTNINGNYSVNLNAQTITFANNTFMVSEGGAGNLTNVTYQYYSRVQTCQWSNGTGNAFCERDWSVAEVCMGKGQPACMTANASGCNWTIDSWCSGTGNGTDWCTNNGGWCEHNDFKPKDCWKYSSGGSSSECNAVSGCSWKTDSYSQPRCEVNWSANCWLNMDSSTCGADNNCIWDVPPQGGGWCMNKADKCWSYTNTTCNSALSGRCYWQSWGSGEGGSCQSMCWNGSLNTAGTCDSSLGCVWKQESGWCEESAMASCSNTTTMNNQTNCQATTGCKWKNSGWCDPKGGGFSSGSGASGGGGGGGAMGSECYKYDINQTLCTNKSIINISCGWSTNLNPTCEVNWAADCWGYNSVEAGCNATNGCWFKNDSMGSFCTNLMDQCWQNQSLQSNATLCGQSQFCTNNSWGGCEPKCFSLDSDSCTNETYVGKCKYSTGWCNPAGMNDMFNDMESGAPAPLGQDTCGEAGMQASVDICGFGMKDMGDSYGFGMGVYDFSNASICNKEKLSSFVMGMAGGGGGSGGGTTFGIERTGSGNETVVALVYLDTDGSRTGGCALSHNSSAVGYEFRFKYSSQWNTNTSKAVETFNAYKCEDSDWKAADIKLSAWKTKMCSDVGGPMIAVKKDDLGKFPTLYDSAADMRVYVTTIGNTGNVSTPTDSAGPGWTTPGSVDFDISSAFAYGADSAKFEDILKKGFVQGEDCFNTIDDDGDGNADCNDWDCEYSSKCAGLGVNAASYSDTSAPLVTGVMIEEYPDAALIMYDTNKPTNGTLELYGDGDSQCLNRTNLIYDVGLLSANIRDYKMWHTAVIYNASNTNISLNWPLVAGSTYNYKLKVCDSSGKCSISKCSNFKLPISESKCSYCNFVTRIKPPTGWKVAYDVNRDGTYEHVQGEVCGPNAGMKTNYTAGRKVNVKLYKSDGSTYIEFLNASLTKSGLNDKVRTISTAGDMIHSLTGSYVGLSSETRDKIVNNLHPEACRMKIPVASGATCNALYHCDDSGANCADRTSAAGGAPIDAANCVWNIPDCEFSTYKTSAAPGGTGGTGGSGGSGGGGGAAATTAKEEAGVQDAAESDGSDEGGDSSETSPGSGENAAPTEITEGFGTIFFVILGAIVMAGVITGIYFAVKKKRQRYH